MTTGVAYHPSRIPKKLRFAGLLFQGESLVRIIFSLSPPHLAQILRTSPKSEGGDDMTAIRKTIFTSFVLALWTAALPTSGMAQFGANDASIRDVVRRIQTRTDSLQRAVQDAADRNNYRVDDINRLIVDFENAANQLDRRLGTRRSSSADAQTLLDRGV